MVSQIMKVLSFLLVMVVHTLAADADYDPCRSAGKLMTKLSSFQYDGREVPLKIYLPEQKPAPVILLSHGLGGSREVGAYLGNHWAGRGYVVVAMQHVGSDSSVWKNGKPTERMEKIKAAANGATFLDRMKDAPATIDQLEKWNLEEGSFLFKRMDLEHIGMAGHSYGAVTTQALTGQSFGPMGAKYADPRIDAGLALSPSVPKLGDPKQAFGNVELPMMLMTGTKDGSIIARTDPKSRRLVYAAMPPGSKYELVFKDGEHMAFSDARHEGAARRNPNHHRVILALSTAFMDAYLKGDEAALGWLESERPEKLLEAGDLWQRK